MSTFIKRLYKGANISVHKESQFNSYKTDNRKIIGNVKTQSAIGNNTKKKKKIYYPKRIHGYSRLTHMVILITLILKLMIYLHIQTL